eukprot:439962-Rhodomonas_salina.1
MRGMTQFLGPKGYQLAVQIEMEDITLGGVVMGCAIETNSHIFGSIHEASTNLSPPLRACCALSAGLTSGWQTIVAYDIVSADGELLHVTKENNPEVRPPSSARLFAICETQHTGVLCVLCVRCVCSVQCAVCGVRCAVCGVLRQRMFCVVQYSASACFFSQFPVLRSGMSCACAVLI